MSPEVWTDVRARVAAVAQTIGIEVEWPNETPLRLTRPTTWLAIEAAGEMTEEMEIGSGTWQETGEVWLSLMIPLNSGLSDGLTKRKALSNAFREATGMPVGLVYRGGQTFDPLERAASDDGVYSRLTLVIRYFYQDRTT